MPSADPVHEATLTIEVKCEHCPRTGSPRLVRDRRTGRDRWEHPVMVEMVPGKDGILWYLCVRCWIEGLRSRLPAEATAVVSKSA